MSSHSSDIETGEVDYEDYELSTDRSTRSSFESTQECKTATSRFRKSKKDIESESENKEWKEYVENDTKHLMRKCRQKSRVSGLFSTLFAFLNDSTNIYMLLFSLATFIMESIKEDYQITDYITIGLSGIATTLQTAQFMFKFRKRSIYYKQAAIQYKRIYRKISKYFYTTSTEQMAEYLSMAYQDFDKLVLEEHKITFNKFNKSYSRRYWQS